MDHLCRVRHCVNPEHPEPVTHTENQRRGSGVKLTMQSAREIRRLYATGRYNQTVLGKMFGVGQDTVSSVVRHETWKETY